MKTHNAPRSWLLIIWAFALGLFCCGAWADDAPLPPQIEDPECLGINKEPAHATLMPYASLKEALTAKRSASSYARSLNGNWKFNYVPHPAQRPVDFFKPEFDVSSWKDIPVPSCWQLEGYGTPYYRNLGYTFKKDFPRVMSDPPRNYTAYNERNPVGSYRREFEVPADWSGRRIFLTFDGVDSAFFLWINGKSVGYSLNSRNAAEFDITPYLQPGKNMVAVEVYRYSVGSYLEDQDMWRLSGIFRNVTLWSAPQVHMRDFFILTDLDDEYKNATLSVAAKIKNYSNQPAPARQLSMTLYDLAGAPIANASGTAAVPALAAGEEQSVNISFPVANPSKWTAETPNLYTTVLTLTGDAEIISTRTGFREIEIKGRIFMVNGQPVKLKGANRHENEPDTGHYVKEERMIRDLELLKQGNCNHVRTCHYPDDPRWYELCDEWGIYLMSEANCECHGAANQLDREPRLVNAIVDRNVANVQSFKNHASVTLWSMGNECGGGSSFRTALRAIKEIDKSRPVHYEPLGTGRGNPADIDSRMYTDIPGVERFARSTTDTKPFYLCEYAHAMFNSMGAIGEYNDLFDKYPALMGGAIWEWEDQGVWNRRDPNRQFIAYGGGFKEVPNDRYFIHKGVVFSERAPKPHYPEMKRAYQWIGFTADDLAAGKIKIKNRYAFLNLDQFKGGWTLSEDGTILEKGDLKTLALAPGAEETIEIPFKRPTLKPGARYYLQVSFYTSKDYLWAMSGFEVATIQFQLPLTAPAITADVSKMSPLKFDDKESSITITGQGFSVVFDKAEGVISQLSRDGKNLLVDGGGPKLHLWRAQHRNDDDWAAREWNRYGLTRLNRSVTSIKASQLSPGAVQVESEIKAEGQNQFVVVHKALYTVYGDGSIVAKNDVNPTGARVPLARLGVRLQLDKQMDQFAFLGRGPMENYPDRKRGSDVGLYSSSVKEQMTPYAKPMECGNHEDVRWAALSGKNIPSLMVQSDDKDLQVSALPYTDEVMNPIEYTVDLPASVSSVLTIAGKTLGVGSASCGPRPLDKYIPWSTPDSFTYVLRLLPAGTSNLAEVGRSGMPK